MDGRRCLLFPNGTFRLKVMGDVPENGSLRVVTCSDSGDEKPGLVSDSVLRLSELLPVMLLHILPDRLGIAGVSSEIIPDANLPAIRFKGVEILLGGVSGSSQRSKVEILRRLRMVRVEIVGANRTFFLTIFALVSFSMTVSSTVSTFRLTS